MKHFTFIWIMLLSIISLTGAAYAESTPARILIGTREAAVSPAPVFSGGKVLAPIGILSSLGATAGEQNNGTINVMGAQGQTGDVEIERVSGVVMLPMDKVAGAIGLGYSWDEEKRTLTLTAKLQSVEFTDNKLSINCTMPVSCKITSWESSSKLIVDIPSAELATPANEVFVGGELVNRLRLGQPQPGTARVVMDLNKPVSYKQESDALAAQVQISVSGKSAAQPGPKAQAKVVKQFDIGEITVEPLDDSRFQVVVKTASRGAVNSSISIKPAKITASLPGGKLADAAMSYTGSHPMLTAMNIVTGDKGARLDLSLRRPMVCDTQVADDSVKIIVRPPDHSGGKFEDKLIVIDPGHGNPRVTGTIDTGAKCAGAFEKDINLAIAKDLSAALQKLGARTKVTRTGDNGLSLPARPQMAIDLQADFFVSIHCNSTEGENTQSGIETYYHFQEPSPKMLAEAIHDGVCSSTGMCDRKARSDRSLGYATGLAVLRGLSGSGIPGVLLECGYINHSSDRCRLLDSGYRKKLVEGIIKGLRQYIEGN